MKTLILFLALVGGAVAQNVPASDEVVTFFELQKIHDELHLDGWFKALSDGHLYYYDVRNSVMGGDNGTAAAPWAQGWRQAKKDVEALKGRDAGKYADTVGSLQGLIVAMDPNKGHADRDDIPVKRALQATRKAWHDEIDLSLIY